MARVIVRAVKVDLPFPRPDFLIPKTNFFRQMEPPLQMDVLGHFLPPFLPAAGFWGVFHVSQPSTSPLSFRSRSAAIEKKDSLLSELKQANNQLSVRQTQLPVSV